MSGSRSMPLRLDARLGEQRQELAAPTADVEHRRRVAEVVDVLALAIADQLPRAAHPALEGEVVEGLRRRLADRSRSAAGCGLAGAAGLRSTRMSRSSCSASLVDRPAVAARVSASPCSTACAIWSGRVPVSWRTDSMRSASESANERRAHRRARARSS